MLRSAPALLLLVVAIADIQRWADPDLWGHVAFGRAMLATRYLTFHDPYSYSAPGHLWLNHEWLTELIMGALYNRAGVVGLKLMKVACCGAIFVALAIALAETRSPLSVQVAIVLAAAVAIGPQIQFRPQLFTFAMLSALLAVLTRFTYGGSDSLVILIPMLLLWANLHGGFFIAPVTLAVFAGVRTFTDFRAGRGIGVGLRVFGIFLIATLSTLITPYGWWTWRAVAHAMRNPRTREVIVDWQPLLSSMAKVWRHNHFGVVPELVAIAMMVALFASLVLAPRRGDSALVAIGFVMIGASFVAMRNLPLALIACAPALARHWSALLRMPRTSRISRRYQFMLGAMAAVVLVSTGLFSSRLRAGESMPGGALDMMNAHALHGNILSTFNWGEYLIWHTAPTSKVFIDGRYDTVYPLSVIDDYLEFQFDGPGAREVPRKYPHDFILVRNEDRNALAAMSAAGGWKRIYRDATCILFARADSAAARITPVEIPPRQTAPSFFP